MDDIEDGPEWDLEKVYDEQIAPLMTQIIAICKEHGMPVCALFRYAPDGYCETVVHNGDGRQNSAAFFIAQAAIRARGNLDSMVIAAAKRATIVGHNSMILKMIENAANG